MKFIAKTLEDVAVHFDEMAARNRARLDELGGADVKRPTREAIECGARAFAFALAAEVIRETELESGRRRKKAERRPEIAGGQPV